LNITNTAGSDLTIEVKYEYNETERPTFDGVKLYYTINSDFTDAEWTQAVADDDAGTPSTIFDARNDIEIDVKADDNKFLFTIPVADINSGDVIRYYFRGVAKDTAGDKVKDYFSPSQDETFDHDIYSQWTLETVK
ncbi:MAG: hypothetical protein KAH32_06420, partial [Chlamydiia bacterium]|nr:hypothetical protein [Chlamydiia bacterium]